MIKFKNKEQQQVFIGTLLGDGCIFKSKANINYRMNLAHSLKQEDYFKMKYEILKDIFQKEYKLIEQFDKRTKKTYKYLKVQTKTNDFFTKWYNNIYLNGKKHISEEVIKLLDKQAIAILYFDDGHKEKHCEAVDISLNEYDYMSVERLKNKIEELFDLKATITKRMGIRIPTKYGRKFKDAIKKYASPSVLYKLL